MDGQFNGVSQTFLTPTPVAMVVKICDFQHKIGHNSTCIKDMTVILAPGRGNGRFKSVSQTLLRLTSVAMVTKIWEFQHNISFNSDCVRDTTQIPASCRGFKGPSI